MKKSIAFEKKVKTGNIYLLVSLLLFAILFYLVDFRFDIHYLLQTMDSNPFIYFLAVISPATFFISLRMIYFTKIYKERYKDSWTQILKEIDAEDTIYYEKANFYLTKNYLISCTYELKIFECKDIVDFYITNHYYKGVSLHGKRLYVVTSDRKNHKVLYLKIKYLELFNEICNILILQFPHILKGSLKEK